MKLNRLTVSNSPSLYNLCQIEKVGKPFTPAWTCTDCWNVAINQQISSVSHEDFGVTIRGKSWRKLLRWPSVTMERRTWHNRTVSGNVEWIRYSDKSLASPAMGGGTWARALSTRLSTTVIIFQLNSARPAQNPLNIWQLFNPFSKFVALSLC